MNNTKQRNYQIDVLKLIFAFFVFFSHTCWFIGENTRFITFNYAGSYGWWGVFPFFIISGMLMVNSLSKADVEQSKRGETALKFVLEKFKKIALEYWVSLFLLIVVFFICGIPNTGTAILRAIPEIFCLNQAGFKTGELNTASWYLSAMLVSMIPLAYLLIRNKDLYIHIIAPILAFICYGYLFNFSSSKTPNQYEFSGIIYVGIIRAIAGICFGDIAWLISKKLKERKSKRIVITVLELFLYIIIFINWIFNINDIITAYSINLLLPIALGISFSQESYVCELFSNKLFKHISSFSLALYLNHIAARKIVLELFPGRGYCESVVLMITFTVLLIVLYFLIIKLLKRVYLKVKY